ncbi:rhoGAP domain containing protein [Musa troglodytarum]|uniref:RhoGAP domain containing protein n=1 Tax=Musa troglodytarum TaxID=320322 RepID=A0A9E7FFG2_9LILI|nr:rhoGAP domain containing protein [Musa troglodytarum]
MAEVLPSPSHFPSSPRGALSCESCDEASGFLGPFNGLGGGEEEAGRSGGGRPIEEKRERRVRGGGGGQEVVEEQQRQLSVLALVLTVVRKSLLGCKTEGAVDEDSCSMDIGRPTDVQHVAHVTFDRFHGFLGLPVEFEPEVPRIAPSARSDKFLILLEKLQLSLVFQLNLCNAHMILEAIPFQPYSCKCRDVFMSKVAFGEPEQAEGIFRINGENSEEEYVRNQLDNGIVPEGVDVHCLAGLIKAWFRELPMGLLDSLSSEQVTQCQTEEDCDHITRLLPPTEAALLDWAINLMADVAQEEQQNKMNAHNVADPLSALMYVVQVMNFLRMLIVRTLKERQQSILEDAYAYDADPSDDDGHYSPKPHLEACSEEAVELVYVTKKPVFNIVTQVAKSTVDEAAVSPRTFCDTAAASEETAFLTNSAQIGGSSSGYDVAANGSNAVHTNYRRKRMGRLNSHNHKKGRKGKLHRASFPAEKSKGTSIVSRINSETDRAEAWR